jgi:RNA polymerase-interacting CarD/CdnL/TRCF family regulator
MNLEVGARVHFPTRGLGTIESEVEREGVACILVSLDAGHRIGVPVADAASVLWALPSLERARALEAKLLTPAGPDERSWEERYQAFECAVSEGTLEDCVEELRQSLARGTADSIGERRLRMVLEENALAPVAESLGKDRQTMLAEAAARQGSARAR